jgi:hypothetical protein
MGGGLFSQKRASRITTTGICTSLQPGGKMSWAEKVPTPLSVSDDDDDQSVEGISPCVEEEDNVTELPKKLPRKPRHFTFSPEHIRRSMERDRARRRREEMYRQSASLRGGFDYIRMRDY